MSLPSLRLLARDKELIDYLLNHRGYNADFRDNVLSLMKDLTPYPVPSFAGRKQSTAHASGHEQHSAIDRSVGRRFSPSDEQPR